MKENKLNKLFVSYNIALELKNKKFDDDCVCIYTTFDDKNRIFAIDQHWGNSLTGIQREYLLDNETLAPMFQQVIDWFRITHKIEIEIHSTSSQLNFSEGYNYYLYNRNTGYEDFSMPKNCPTGEFISNDYYITLTKAIIEALELI